MSNQVFIKLLDKSMGGVSTMQVDKENPIPKSFSDEISGKMTPQEETIYPAMHGKWKKTIVVEIVDNYPVERARYPEPIKLKITATYLGLSKPKWDTKYYHNTYRIKITNLKTGKSMSVRFWDSIKNTEENRALTPEDILIATKMIVDDAFSYYDLETPENFMHEFGFNEKEATRSWKACKEIYEDLCNIGLDPEAQSTISRVINEYEEEDKLSELIKEVRRR
jgi:hypothetical protein